MHDQGRVSRTRPRVVRGSPVHAAMLLANKCHRHCIQSGLIRFQIRSAGLFWSSRVRPSGGATLDQEKEKEHDI